MSLTGARAVHFPEKNDVPAARQLELKLAKPGSATEKHASKAQHDLTVDAVREQADAEKTPAILSERARLSALESPNPRPRKTMFSKEPPVAPGIVRSLDFEEAAAVALYQHGGAKSVNAHLREKAGPPQILKASEILEHDPLKRQRSA